MLACDGDWVFAFCGLRDGHVCSAKFGHRVNNVQRNAVYREMRKRRNKEVGVYI